MCMKFPGGAQERGKSMNRKSYSITNMNGYTNEDRITFSYDVNQNETGETAGTYSITDMNGFSGEDSRSFRYTSMNGQ